MWFIDEFTHGFREVPGAALSVFRLFLGAAIVAKFLLDHRWGVVRRLADDPPALTLWRYRRSAKTPRILLTPALFRAFYSLRFLAAFALLLGFPARLAAGIVAAWLFFEFTFDRKFNTLFLGVCAVPLTLNEAAGSCFGVRQLLFPGSQAEFLACETGRGQVGDSWAQVLLVILVFSLYWNSAWHKLRSRQFLSGDTLYKVVEQLHAVRQPEFGNRREILLPDRLIRRLLVKDGDRTPALWRTAAIATIVAEAALPLVLSIPVLWIWGVALGLGMHAAFTVLLPRKLVPFGLASVGTYVLFPDPFHVADFLSGSAI